jgi:outer membrane protein W
MLILKWVICALFFCIATLPGALYAQSPAGSGGKNSYAVLKMGSFIPDSGDLDQLNAKNGFTGQIGFGYYLYPNFALEAAVGYSEFRADTQIANTDRKFKVYPLEVAGKLGIPIGFVEPYFELGLGAYYVKSTAGNLEETSMRPGAFVGGGINFHLSKSVFLGAEARYSVLSASAPVATPYSGSSNVDVNLYGVIVTGNLGFRF